MATPEVNPPVVYLDGSVLRGGAETQAAKLGAEDRSLILNITPLTTEWSTFEVQLLSASGSEVWTGRGLELTDYGTLDLRMSRGVMPDGDYQVRLFGLDGDRRELLQETELVVRGE